MTRGPDAEPPGPPPLPPADLHARELPIEIVRAGTLLARIHPAAFGAIHSGPAEGTPPRGRWDAPDGEFRVCYVAEAAHTAFAETFLRAPGLLLLDAADLSTRHLAEVLVTRDLRLAAMSGRGLARMGATAAVCSGPYSASRVWAGALYAHPSRPDGIRYRARHDDDGFALAVFHPAADALDEIGSYPLTAHRLTRHLGEWLDRYGIGLV